MLIVFSDDTRGKTSLNANEIERIVKAARLFGCRVFVIPSDFSECKTADNALAYVPEFDEPALAVWVGFIPTYERYEAIYRAALAKNIQLVNSPQQHRLAMEFDQFYPLIERFTPKSLMIENLEELQKVPAEIGFPVFVKGTVKSNKEDGMDGKVSLHKIWMTYRLSQRRL